jgi:hypothetical protein
MPIFRKLLALVLNKPGLFPFLRNESSLLAVTGSQHFNECSANCGSERASQENDKGGRNGDLYLNAVQRGQKRHLGVSVGRQCRIEHCG